MMTLNRFLRKALSEGLNFKRVFFIREEAHPTWDRYFPKGVLAQFTHKVADGDVHRFQVAPIGQGWTAREDDSDMEILSTSRFRGGIKIFLGRGTRNGFRSDA